MMLETNNYVYMWADSFCVVKGIEQEGTRWFELSSICKAFDLPFTPSVVKRVQRSYFIVLRTEPGATARTFISEEGIDFLFLSVLDYCEIKSEEIKNRFKVV